MQLYREIKVEFEGKDKSIQKIKKRYLKLGYYVLDEYLTTEETTHVYLAKSIKKDIKD